MCRLCGNCRFFEPDYPGDAERLKTDKEFMKSMCTNLASGECRRKPPVIFKVNCPNSVFATKFPEVASVLYCGEWMARQF